MKNSLNPDLSIWIYAVAKNRVQNFEKVLRAIKNRKKVFIKKPFPAKCFHYSFWMLGNCMYFVCGLLIFFNIYCFQNIISGIPSECRPWILGTCPASQVIGIYGEIKLHWKSSKFFTCPAVGGTCKYELTCPGVAKGKNKGDPYWHIRMD